MLEHAVPDGSRTLTVHRIPLYDENGEPLTAADSPARAYSPAVTCGKCHEYGLVGGGRHFNYARGDVTAGRPGEPWILLDRRTGTQAPISYRDWPGTWRPADFGVSPWDFIQRFGRQLPGGGVGEDRPDTPDPAARWFLSGDLAIDCLACHNADRRQDPAAWATQIERQNFFAAAAAADGLAHVTGFTNLLSIDTYDPVLRVSPDQPQFVPKVVYRPGLFNPKNEAFIDVAGQPPDARCTACHSRVNAGASGDGDVHLAGGLACVDCHREDLGHQTTRGYEGEPPHRRVVRSPAGNRMSDDPAEVVAVDASTCRGCHEAGRLGAPAPRHASLPLLHLDKLACTACHSGPPPSARAGRVQTSMAHALGLHTIPHSPDGPPYVRGPILMRGPDERIAPYNLLWPAFWARMTGDTLTPVPPAEVEQVAGAAFGPTPNAPPPADAPFELPAPETIAAVLAALTDAFSREPLASAPGPVGVAGEPVYVAAGKLHRLARGGGLTREAHPAAEPYAWPIAHDVRPAAQSLGAGGCADCHVAGSAFFFGAVSPDPAWPSTQPALSGVEGADAAVPMHRFQQLDAGLLGAWSAALRFRDAGVVLMALAAVVVALVLVGRGLSAAGAIARAESQSSSRPAAVLAAVASAAMAVSFLALAATGLWSWRVGGAGSMHGWLLWAHGLAGPAFLVALAGVAVFRLRAGPFAGRASGALHWLVLLLGLLACSAVLVTMLKVVAAPRQATWFALHRWLSAAAATAIVVQWLVVILLRGKGRKRSRG